MINLPNPFESALEPSRVADTAAAPGLTDPPVAAAVSFTEPSTSTGGHQESQRVALEPPPAGATDYIPELFSSFVRRRCMDKVNPPLPQHCRREFELDEAAFFDAILPPEPPPIFLRKPSQAFMRALFELAN